VLKIWILQTPVTLWTTPTEWESYKTIPKQCFKPTFEYAGTKKNTETVTH